MGIVKALKKANDWHADRLHSGGRVMAHTGTGVPTSYCAGCGKRAKKLLGKKGHCGSVACGKAISASL